MDSRTAHILCTEDDDDSREMLVMYLESSGYQVTCTRGPAEAIPLVQQHSYDLILVDNWMPEMTGAELTREIRKFDVSTPILFYSGAGYESDKKEAKDSGAQGYLVKEITNNFLKTKIRLDMNDQWHPKRTSETGEVEEAGPTSEVWVNFGWTGPSEGDFFRPFNTITAAAVAVADGGVIKIMPGWTTETPSFPRNKRMKLVAPIGNVTFGVR
ncbi:MAG TPA: response regulator [Pyrinomonadaceae bacterium]